MEESLPWRIIYIAAIFSLIVLGLAYYFISPRESAYFSEEKTQKIAEFKNTRIEGRKEGVKSWEFFAREGWTEKNQAATHLYNVGRGKIYKDGKLLVSELSAPEVKVDRRADIVEALGRLNAYIDLGKVSAQTKPRQEWTKLAADYIKYVSPEKRSEISGHIVLTKKDSVINTEKIFINHESKIATMPGMVRIDRPDGIISAETVEYLGENEQLNAAGRVRFDLREGKIKTRVRCDRSVFFVDLNKEIALSGSLEVTQGKKAAVAAAGAYSKKEKRLYLKGNTRTILEKAGAILKEDTARNLRHPEAKGILKEKTVVLAEEIVFSTKTGDARASGSVEATQKGREARSDSARYDDRREILTLAGNVFMRKGEDWIACRQVVISIRHETFEASGVKAAKFKI